MSNFKNKFDELLHISSIQNRFTQDTPIYPEVWQNYALIAESNHDSHKERQDLLLSPHRASTAQDLVCHLVVSLHDYNLHELKLFPNKTAPNKEQILHEDWLSKYDLSYTDTHVCTRLTFRELICVALPLTKWWQHYVVEDPSRMIDSEFSHDHTSVSSQIAAKVESMVSHKKYESSVKNLTGSGKWFMELAGLIWWRMCLKSDLKNINLNNLSKRMSDFLDLIQHESSEPHLWGISINRKAETTVRRSIPAIKADAANLLFRPHADGIAWAIIDSGIDATHLAFRKRKKDGEFFSQPFENGSKNHTRIVATYDFTKLREKLSLSIKDLGISISQMSGAFDEKAKELRKRLVAGSLLDWESLLETIRINYDWTDLEKSIPKNLHGTHVAGILGADWETENMRMVGVCPSIMLYDLRVLDQEGMADEFSILAALHFVRNRNATSDIPLIHGINISMSINHDVRSYACGQTPVCEECDRLVRSGVVVVAAAGNRGFAGVDDNNLRGNSGYRESTITDPGNAERVITVGATHRSQPHKYGVSYFSSRGPTGDGRMKPDLVAPGEKIEAPVPGNKSKSLDGTSMAAPHVSGAAALLMARNSELIGNPERIKMILCQTATNLGRERHYQGAGMLDILRALQFV